MIFLQLFIVFLQIGIFGFGGGYSMISLIQGQVVTQYHIVAAVEPLQHLKIYVLYRTKIHYYLL